MRRFLQRALLTALFVCAVNMAHAQALYGQYTLERANLNGNVTNFQGGTFGFYYEHGGALPIHLGMDARVSVLRAESDGRINRFLIGPRVSVVPHVIPVKIYGEGLVGVQSIHQRTASASVTVDKKGAAYGVVGGLEYTFFPHLDWRLIEVGYNHVPSSGSGVSSNSVQFSSGLVVRF